MARTLALFRDSLKERDRFAAEAERQRKTIAAAIATISEGFVLYDSDDRIVLFNEQFRAIYPGLADIIRQGTTFGEVLEAVISRSLVDLGGQSPQEWIAERKARREHSGGFAEYRYGGRYVRISERQSRAAERSQYTPTSQSFGSTTWNSNRRANYRKSPIEPRVSSWPNKSRTATPARCDHRL